MHILFSFCFCLLYVILAGVFFLNFLLNFEWNFRNISTVALSRLDNLFSAYLVQQEHLGPIADRIHLSTESGNSSTDIVFSHVSKKKKANKKKTKGKCCTNISLANNLFLNQIKNTKGKYNMNLNKYVDIFSIHI